MGNKENRINELRVSARQIEPVVRFDSRNVIQADTQDFCVIEVSQYGLTAII